MVSIPSGNEIKGFSDRTRKNLAFIEQEYKDGANVHVVTQVTLSLFGIIAFPFDKYEALKTVLYQKPVETLMGVGWVKQVVKLDASSKHSPTITINDLCYHLRNALAHGRITFSNDSRELSDLIITFEDVKWRAEITGPEAKKFCLKFLDFAYEKVA